MDDCAIFGEANQKRHQISTASHYYKGTKVPWVIHDCNGTSCAFCRKEKRKFVELQKKEQGK